MAKKRQLTVEDRQTIVNLKREGLSYREIAKKVQVSVKGVSYTVKRHSETGGIWDRNRSGRPKATTKMEDKFLRITSRRNEQLTAQQLRAQLNLGRRKQVSLSTVKRRLDDAGLSGCWVSVGKPSLKVQTKNEGEPSLKVQIKKKKTTLLKVKMKKKKKKVEEPLLKVQEKVEEPLLKVQQKLEEPLLKVQEKVEEPLKVQEKVKEPLKVQEKVEEPLLKVQMKKKKVEEPLLKVQEKEEEPLKVQKKKPLLREPLLKFPEKESLRKVQEKEEPLLKVQEKGEEPLLKVQEKEEQLGHAMQT